MKTLLLGLISFYQKWISSLTRPSCKFYPTCSEYSKDAIKKCGAFKGSYLSIKRILRCHPWAESRVDKIK